MLCKVEGCNLIQNRSGRGYCRKHYDQYRKMGYVNMERTKFTPNEIILKDKYAEMIIYNFANKEVARTFIDIDDVDKVSQFKWCLHNNGYIRNYRNKKTTYLHRFILGLEYENDEVDHINRNKLDNRKANLKVCNHAVNAANRQIKNKYGVHGISQLDRKLSKPFTAKICRNGITYHLGYFVTDKDAVNARLEAETKFVF